jgi:DNA-directed RNA polymerase subunit M/transcription elongation factor TFIIS
MHFCKNCDNMYYIRIKETDDNNIEYYCRNCGYVDDNLLNINTSISKIIVNNTHQNTHNIINKYTKLDPTLPKNDKILCPNSECPTNKKNEKKEIIYLRYDDTNMKYIYLCSTCDTNWTL